MSESSIERALEAYVDEARFEPGLDFAVRYALGLDSADPKFRGKRVRSALCLMVTEALGGKPARAMPAAIACEVLHGFLLAHDDIADGDRVRRGRSSVWAEVGLGAGINTGDVMCALTYRALIGADWDAETKLTLLRALDRTMLETGQGQALDLAARGRVLTRAEVERIALKKTAFYLSFPLEAGAILAGADRSVITALEAFAASLGPMFQLSDDLIDLTDNKGRDLKGNDIREGKCTALVVIACERASGEEQGRLVQILARPRPETTMEDVDWAIALFARLGVHDEVQAMMAGLLERAITALGGVPEPARTRLTQVAQMLFARET